MAARICCFRALVSEQQQNRRRHYADVLGRRRGLIGKAAAVRCAQSLFCRYLFSGANDDYDEYIRCIIPSSI